MKILDKKYINRINEINKLLYNSNNLEYNYSLIQELANYIDNYPKCKECGKYIVFSKIFFIINTKTLDINFDVPKKFEQKFENNIFTISKCEFCVRKKFDKFPSMQRYLFMLKTYWAKYVYDIPKDLYDKINKSKCAVTLDSLINKYGENEGKLRWESYKEKQAYSNSFEYKHKVHGWTKEEYDNYNKSRAVTLENLLNKYKEKGNELWNSYIEKQKLTKSFDYVCNKYGKDKAIEINKSKGITIDNFIKKYGEIEGLKRYNKVSKRMINFYSKISQKCFDKIETILNINNLNYTTYYATKNTEFGIYLKSINKYIKLDYYIKDLNVCIEFNGTIFHADKRVYNENDKPNPFNKTLTAKNIWEIDEERKNILLKEHNIKTYIIWENDYINGLDLNEFINNIIKENTNIEYK